VRKLRASLAIQPIVTAMFAHSPLVEGRIGPNLCERCAVWIGMDPDRSGLLPFAWERDMSFRAYAEWALDVPMFMLKRGSRVIPNTGQTFRAFIADGAEGERATRSDWETHINTLFPEARLYDASALSQLEALISPLSAGLVQKARPEIARSALKATLAGRPVRKWAEDVMNIARASLQRQASLDANGQDESVYLRPLIELLSAGQTPAEALLSAVRASADLRAAVVANARV
jgi:glutamate--cysteine ligase